MNKDTVNSFETRLFPSCNFKVNIYNPMDCSLAGFSVHEILFGGILEWVAMPFSRESS